MTDNITGKVVVITGTSSAMGEATAHDLAAKGAKVVLGAQRADWLDAIVRDIVETGGQATAVATDVTKLENVRTLANTAKETYGRVDVLFNNAGLMPLSRLASLQIDE
jgi:NADP-dependent 3-hydroxy acid dehydrogenase YdfG